MFIIHIVKKIFFKFVRLHIVEKLFLIRRNVYV